jgi:hypothetical protein
VEHFVREELGMKLLWGFARKVDGKRKCVRIAEEIHSRASMDPGAFEANGKTDSSAWRAEWKVLATLVFF